jgi:hypothetical protein
VSQTRHQLVTKTVSLPGFLRLRLAENQGEQKVSRSECKSHIGVSANIYQGRELLQLRSPQILIYACKPKVDPG